MNYYKAIIQYDGTNYCGFQWQKDLTTVQDDFNKALQKNLSGKITTMSASRTDTGVHAVEQIVKITSESSIDCASFILTLNLSLPSQIRCLSLTPSEGAYRPASDNRSKEYRYLFTNKLRSGCIDQLFLANNPYPLDVEKMKACTSAIIGVHDFRNFCSAGSNVKTTVRHVFSCELSEVDPHEVLPQRDLFLLPPELRHCYQLKIVGAGFLKQMVRHLMSALWLVGGGKLSPEEFVSLIDGPEKTNRLWKVASPRGLFLYQIDQRPKE